MKKKRRLLWIGHVLAETGYSRVTENILPYLAEDWDVAVMGVTFDGDPHDKPYRIYRADRLGDPWGVNRVHDMIVREQPEVVILVGEPWTLMAFCQEIRIRMRNAVKVVGYCVVDGENMKAEHAEWLTQLNVTIFPTHFALTQAQAAGFMGGWYIVPHGVNPTVYKPVNQQRARSLIGLGNILARNAFVFGNVNENQPRKRLDLTIEGWARWFNNAGRPERAYLYVHANKRSPVGWDLGQLAKHHGIRGRIVAPAEDVRYGEASMKYVYGALDVQFSTTMGEGWGMCVDPATVIAIRGGVTPMRLIAIADEVLAGDGQFHPVLNKIARVSKTVNVSILGSPELHVSPEHPFFRLPHRSDANEYYERHPMDQAAWVPAAELQPGDYVATVRPAWNRALPRTIDLHELFPDLMFDDEHVWQKMGYSPKTGELRKVKRTVAIDRQFLSFLGWYLAEGSTDDGRRVEIDLNISELAIAEELAAYLLAVFSIPSTVEPNGANACRLRAASSVLARLCTFFCGTGSSAKNLTHLLWQSAGQLGPLLASYAQGDGIEQNGSILITTASEPLAWTVRLIMNTVGIHAGLYQRTRESGQTCWVLSIGGDAHRRFVEWSGYPSKWTQTRNRAVTALVTDKYIFLPVGAVSSGEDMEVMDIEVEHSHDFVGNGVLLHNTTMEGMACGIPQIVPRSAALGEWAHSAAWMIGTARPMFSSQQQNVKQYEPDLDELELALDRAWREETLRRVLGLRGRELVLREDFRWSMVAGGFAAALEDALIGPGVKKEFLVEAASGPSGTGLR